MAGNGKKFDLVKQGKIVIFKANQLAERLNSLTAELYEDGKTTNQVVFFVRSKGSGAGFRTPEEQVDRLLKLKKDKVTQKMIAKMGTEVPYSAHMTNSARHLWFRVDGKAVKSTKKSSVMKQLKEALGHEGFGKLAAIWQMGYNDLDLLNYAKKTEWPNNDALHVELRGGRIGKDHPWAHEVYDGYAQQVVEKKIPESKRNKKFEKRFSKKLAPYFKKYESRSSAH